MSARGMIPRAVRTGPHARAVSRRRKLNSAPPGSEDQSQERTSAQVTPRNETPTQPQVVIDLEATDDDVVICSPRAVAELYEAGNNSRRNRQRAVVDLESAEGTRATRQKRRRVEPNQTIINCEHYVNLEGNSNTISMNEQAMPPPPKEPTFTCPICMAPLVEEMTTKCGHIFCNKCIRAAITAQGKCPTCRRKVTAKELIRVFLPTESANHASVIVHVDVKCFGDLGPKKLPSARSSVFRTDDFILAVNWWEMCSSSNSGVFIGEILS